MLIRIIIPKLIYNSRTSGLNKLRASQVLLGNMDNPELIELIKNNITLLEYRAFSVFKRLDIDGSN